MYSNYTTTNNINGKIYCGVHNEESADKWYLGSGKLIKQAIKKYGRTNFTRVIDHLWEDSEAAFCLESLIVDQNFVNRKDTYNLKLGGEYSGGVVGRKLSQEAKDKISKSKEGIKLPPISQETRDKLSKSHKGHITTKETRDKISESNTGNIQKKVECPHCGITGGLNALIRYHFDNCLLFTGLINIGTKHKKVECPHCNRVGGSGNMKRYHFDNCKERN